MSVILFYYDIRDVDNINKEEESQKFLQLVQNNKTIIFKECIGWENDHNSNFQSYISLNRAGRNYLSQQKRYKQ